METELTLEYGKKLKNTRIIHQGLLCCHSETAARIFKDAQPLRDLYAASDVLRKDLKEFVSPRVTEKTFDENHLDKKARCFPSQMRRRAVPSVCFLTNYTCRQFLLSLAFMITIRSGHGRQGSNRPWTKR